MINFNNKYVTLLAIVVLLYFGSQTMSKVAEDLSRQADNFSQTPSVSMNTLSIDPTRKPEDLTLREKVALSLLTNEDRVKLKETRDVLVPPIDYQAALGDKVFFEIHERKGISTYTVVLGEPNNKLSNNLLASLVGMKKNDSKITFEDEKGEMVEKKITIVYIERKGAN